MKKLFKWIGIVLGSLVGLVLVAGLVLFLIGNFHINRTYEFPPSNLTIPTDEASLEFGKHRVETLCQSCHGPDLSGSILLEDPMLGVVEAANLTTGAGGIGREFTSDEDYVRAIRHGIDPEGKPIYMPAVHSTSQLSDKDLGSIIAYLKTVPPVDNTTIGFQVTPLAKILLGAGMLPPFPVEMVNHETHITAPERGVSVEYGKYLMDTNDCRDCHGDELAGAEYPDPTIYLITPNLTPGGEVGFWSEEEFINTLRTGTKPSGTPLSEIMPWKTYRMFTDDELKAIYIYLQSLPKLKQYTE
jgi:mono/diheme cytochrome c family protein